MPRHLKRYRLRTFAYNYVRRTIHKNVIIKGKWEVTCQQYINKHNSVYKFILMC